MNRITPLLPAAAMKTYEVVAPLATHYRDGTCQEVDCGANAYGWVTLVDVATDLGRRQANYIRLHSGRTFTATEVGTLVTFSFSAGQKCFAEHKVPLEREQFFRVRGGDWRGDPRRIGTVLRRPDDWVDDFANHQQTLADRLQEG